MLAGFNWPNEDVPVAFVEMGEEGWEDTHSESKMNYGEAERVMEVLQGVLEAGECTISEIGIITPYTGQVLTPRQQLAADWHALGEATEEALAGEATIESGEIKAQA